MKRKEMERKSKKEIRLRFRRIVSIALALCMLMPAAVYAEETGSTPILSNEGTQQAATTAQTGLSETAAATQNAGTAAQASETAAAAQNAESSAASTVQTSSGGRTIDPNKPMIAFTYDDGPCTGPGYRIIEAFEKYGQRCTFFVVGDRLSTRTDELKRIVSSGFELGNHSYDHAYFNKLSDDEIRQEVAKCNAAIEKYAGVTPTLMRLPGGTQSERIRAAVGMPIILWNIDTLDWKTRNADSTVSKVLGKVKDGDIVLMHELYYASAEATERLVPELVAQGFQLVTVSELVKYKGVTLENSRVYYSF